MMNQFKWVVVLSVLCCMCRSVRAADYTYDDGDPNNHLWSSKFNWTGDAVPVAPIGKIHHKNGICVIDSSAGNIGIDSHFYLAETNDANMVMTPDAGSLTTDGYMIVGYTAGKRGYLEVNGGTCDFRNSTIGLGIGWSGSGTMVVNGGTVAASSVRMPHAAQAAAGNRLEIHGGTMTSRDTFIMSYPVGSTDNEVLIDGGALYTQTHMRIGNNAGLCTFTVKGTGHVQTTNSTTVGYGDGSNGVLTIESGTLQTGGNLNIGLNAGAAGTVNVTGGEMVVGLGIICSAVDGAEGSLAVSGGWVTCMGGMVMRQAGAVTVSGGEVVVNDLQIGVSPQAGVLFNMTGGAFACRGDDRVSLLQLRKDGRLAGFGIPGAIRFEYDRASDLTHLIPDLTELNRATYPIPAHEDTVLLANYNTTLLQWTAGDGAVSHHLYFGTDGQLVAARDSSVYQGSVSEATFNPGKLLPDTVYYWRVDEVRADMSVVGGHVWAFYVESSIEIDNFEDYDDSANLIANAWTASNGTLELVSGNLAYEGAKAMLVKGTAAWATVVLNEDVSFADRIAAGMEVMVLYFRGYLTNSPQIMSLTLEDAFGNSVTTVYPGQAGDVIAYAPSDWHKWVIDVADFAGIDLEHITGLKLNLNNPGPCMVYFDKIRLYSGYGCDPSVADASDLNDDCTVDINDLAIVAADWLDSTLQLGLDITPVF